MIETAGAPPRQTRRQIARRLLLVPLLKVLLALLLTALGAMAASLAGEAYFRHRLARSGGDFGPFLSRWPPTLVSASARRLEELASPLGLEIATAKRPARARPTGDQKALGQPAHAALGTYLEHLLMRADDDSPPVPAAVTAFLDLHRDRLLACRKHVLASPDLTWEWEPEKLLEGPIPSLSGILKLQKLFFVSAVLAADERDRGERLEWMDAIRALDDAMLRRPELISLLVAMAGDKMLHRLCRTLSGVPPGWGARLAGLRVRERLIFSLRVEAAIGWAIGSGKQTGLDLSPAVAWLMGPYISASGYELAERMLRTAEAHRHLSACDLTNGELRDLWSNDAPRWNIVGRAAWPDLRGSTVRVLRRELDQELTELVLTAKSGGPVPASVPSRACRGASWAVDTANPGRLTIALDRRLAVTVPAQEFWYLPLRYDGTRPP